MSVQSNGNATRFGGVTGRGFMPGVSGNPGGRPKGLGAYIRDRTGNGQALLDFLAVVAGDVKALGHRPRLRDRMEAACELLNRGWGRVAQATSPVEETEEPQTTAVEDLREQIRALPADLREAVGQAMLRRREARLAIQRILAEAQMRSFMPGASPLGNGDGPHDPTDSGRLP